MKNILKTIMDATKIAIEKAVKSIPQSDWNQNDPTAPDYVKNRPFWIGDPVEIVIVEETTFELADGMGAIISTHPLEVGTEYIVTIDGVQYNAVVKMHLDSSMPYIGNIGLPGMGEDTGETFFIAPMSSDTELGIMIVSDVLEHAVKIVGMASEVHKIDEKYLPTSHTTPIYDFSYNSFSTDFNTDGNLEDFSAYEEEYYQLLDIIKWSKEENGIIYDFIHNCKWRVSDGYYENGYPAIVLNSQYFELNIVYGFSHVKKQYKLYMDEEGVLWGNMEMITTPLINSVAEV